MRSLRKTSLLIIMAFLVPVLFGEQEAKGQEWNFSSLSVIYGSPVPFNLFKIDDYRSGIRVDGNTASRLGVTVVDSSSNGSTPIGFDLEFRAYNNPPGIESESNTLNLDQVQIEVSNTVGMQDALGGGTVTLLGLQDLSNTWTSLMEYRVTANNSSNWADLDWMNDQALISYEAGIANGPLLDTPPGSYGVSVEFRLVPVF